MLLSNKKAFITGAASGIGAATARRFVAEGAAVAMADLNEQAGHALCDELRASGANACFVTLDVTSSAAWAKAIADATKHLGGVDVLVNNAGVYARRTVMEVTEADLDRMLAVNVKGVLLGVQAALPVMLQAGRGSIINLSSIAGLIGSGLSTDYNASKGAVRILTKSIAIQYARDNIRCNSVHPAPIETAMGYEAMPEGEIRQRRLEEIPMGRMGKPEEVANAIVFLASELSSYMTGSELVVDGGVTAK